MNSLLLPLAFGGDAGILSTVRTRVRWGRDAPTTAAETAALLSRFLERDWGRSGPHLEPRPILTGGAPLLRSTPSVLTLTVKRKAARDKAFPLVSHLT